MSELSRKLESVLVELLEAMEGGAAMEACLARYPKEAHLLRPYLELHSRLLGRPAQGPSAADYAAGREALLEQLAVPPAREPRSVLPGAPSLAWGALHRWVRGLSPASGRYQLALRVAAVGVLFLLVGGGTLGASAAAGFKPSRALLSSVGLVGQPRDAEGEHVARDERPTPTPEAPDETTTPATDGSSQVVAPPQNDRTDASEATPITPEPTASSVIDVSPIETPGIVIEPAPTRVDALCAPREALQWFPQLTRYVRACSAEEFASLIAPLGGSLCVPEELASRFTNASTVRLPVCTAAQAKALVWYLFAKGYCVPEVVAQRVATTNVAGIRVCTADAVLSALLDLIADSSCTPTNTSLYSVLCPEKQEETAPLDGTLGTTATGTGGDLRLSTNN